MKKYTTDWLNTYPVFYNEKTGAASHNVNDVIDWQDVRIHPEGLYNYVDFGYSVFGQTPVMDVKFLLPCCTYEDGKITRHPDPSEMSVDGDVFEAIKWGVINFQLDHDKTILPLSGGYDSRLLACMVDPVITDAYTFGISPLQTDSSEVVRAEKVAHKLKIKWKQIFLGDYHDYIDDWLGWYGPAVHAHGMYHVEFYKKIGAKGYGMLSGIGGDLLSNERPLLRDLTPGNLVRLGHTHGMSGDVSQMNYRPDTELREKYLTENKHRLNDVRLQTIETIRMKSTLISYLLNVPRFMGLHPYSPFMEPEIALLMLRQPRRKGRQWVREYFRKYGVDILPCGNRMNTLDFQAIITNKLKPIDKNILSKYFNPGYIDWINSRLMKIPALRRQYYLMHKTPYFKEILRIIGLKERITEAYSAYLTLYPLQKLFANETLR